MGRTPEGQHPFRARCSRHEKTPALDPTDHAHPCPARRSRPHVVRQNRQPQNPQRTPPSSGPRTLLPNPTHLPSRHGEERKTLADSFPATPIGLAENMSCLLSGLIRVNVPADSRPRPSPLRSGGGLPFSVQLATRHRAHEARSNPPPLRHRPLVIPLRPPSRTPFRHARFFRESFGNHARRQRHGPTAGIIHHGRTQFPRPLLAVREVRIHHANKLRQHLWHHGDFARHRVRFSDSVYTKVI